MLKMFGLGHEAEKLMAEQVKFFKTLFAVLAPSHEMHKVSDPLDPWREEVPGQVRSTSSQIFFYCMRSSDPWKILMLRK